MGKDDGSGGGVVVFGLAGAVAGARAWEGGYAGGHFPVATQWVMFLSTVRAGVDLSSSRWLAPQADFEREWCMLWILAWKRGFWLGECVKLGLGLGPG